MDMETSEDEEEDGQINKFDEYDEKDRRSPSKAVHDDEPVQYEDLKKICLSRDLLAKQYMTPWFEELVKGERLFLIIVSYI
jgi:RNA polymerase-associated protein RTF1